MQQFAKQERQGALLRQQLNLDNLLLEMELMDQSLQIHHSMANAPRRDNMLNLLQVLQAHQTDLTVKVKITFEYQSLNECFEQQPDFTQNLKDHLLSRLLGLDYDGDKQIFTPEERSKIEFTNLNSVVESKLLRINYTIYDICRDYDCYGSIRLTSF